MEGVSIMGVSKGQKLRFILMCQCGCGELFTPFPVYKKGCPGLYYAQYKVGHHPNLSKSKPAWNKGLKKGDHPSIERMGYQPGHKPYNDWSHVNERLRADKALRAKWLANKRGKTPWNKGKTKEEYPNGIKSGPDHGNWCGNARGLNDLAVMKKFKLSIMRRDKYTCQHCGDKNHAGRGSRIRLEVHHIVSIAENESLAFEPTNAITLCATCHRATENYGTKVVNLLKKQGGN